MSTQALIHELKSAPRPSLDARDIERLRFRRQFVMGPCEVDGFAGWTKARVARRYYLYAHPDLAMTQVRSGGLKLTLLGFAVDAQHPQDDDRAILERLASNALAAHQVPPLTGSLGGRWLIVVDDGRATIAFSDATGLRQAFHTAQGPVWLSSNADHIARLLELNPCPQAAEEFLNLPAIKADKEYAWPPPGCPYSELRRLRTNHYFNLSSGRVVRFWPWGAMDELPVEACADRCATMLRNLVHGAARRFPLVFTLTAGVDSRTVLAAARGMANLETCTHTYWGMDERSPDVAIPRRLSRAAGFGHRLVPCPQIAAPSWRELHMSHIVAAHEVYAPITQGLYVGLPPGLMSVKGCCSEIARAYYYPTSKSPVDLEAVAVETHMETSPYARAILADWLKGATEVNRRHGLPVMDLLYWEQRMSSWQATSQAEYDLVHETFSPFNCRDLLQVMLAAPTESRNGSDCRLHVEIIRRLWPELLCEPFNPLSFGGRIGLAAKQFVRRSGLRPLARRIRLLGKA